MIFEYEVLAVSHSGDVGRLDVEDFLDAEATVPHQSDCDFTLERGGHAREGLVERVIEMFSMKRAGCWNCVYERQHPARRSFG
jgi:hypothetical protein